MKRKMIAVVLTLFMMLGIVGCNAEGLSLYAEMNKASAWEATESTGNMLITADMLGEKVELGADFSGYTNTKEMQAYIEMNIKTFKLSSIEADVKMSPVKIYIDKQAIYISKTYFTDLIKMSGDPIPEVLSNIDAEYIGIDVSEGSEMALLDQEGAIALMDTLFKNSEIEVPITQKDREYTIDLNGDQMVDLSVQFIKELMNNIDAVNKLSDTGLTQKDIDATKEEMEISLTEGKEMVKPMLKGSQATLKYVFEDDAYKEKMDVAIKLAVGEDKMNVNMVVDASAKKGTKKEFKLPTSKVLYTMEELMGLLIPTEAVTASSETVTVSTADTGSAQISKEQIITKNKEMHLPLRETMSQLGVTVNYDAKTKQVTIGSDDSALAVKVITEKGATYIAVSELEKAGFTVIEDEQVIVVVRDSM